MEYTYKPPFVIIEAIARWVGVLFGTTIVKLNYTDWILKVFQGQTACFVVAKVNQGMYRM